MPSRPPSIAASTRLAAERCARLEGQRFERGDADGRNLQRQRQAARHRDADADAGEGAGADRDGDGAEVGKAACAAAPSASWMTSIRISAWPLPMSRTRGRARRRARRRRRRRRRGWRRCRWRGGSWRMQGAERSSPSRRPRPAGHPAGQRGVTWSATFTVCTTLHPAPSAPAGARAGSARCSRSAARGP